MEILNRELKQALVSGELVSLEFGAGTAPREGFYSLDHLPLDGIDIVADLNQSLDLLPDNSVKSIFSHHVFEHIQEFLPLMKEMHRVLVPGGTLEFTVPHFSNPWFYSDPTHVRFFGLYTMYYFVDRENQPRHRKVPTFYSDTRFLIDEVSISFYRRGILDSLLSPLFKHVVNSHVKVQEFYERRLCRLFHANSLRYVMRPVK